MKKDPHHKERHNQAESIIPVRHQTSVHRLSAQVLVRRHGCRCVTGCYHRGIYGHSVYMQNFMERVPVNTHGTNVHHLFSRGGCKYFSIPADGYYYIINLDHDLLLYHLYHRWLDLSASLPYSLSI